MKRARLVMIAILGLLAADVAGQSPSPSSCELFNRGMQQLESRNYTEAEKTLSDVARGQCQDRELQAEAYVRLGEIKLEAGPTAFEAADQAAQAVINQFVKTPAVAGAYIIKGRIALAGDRSTPKIDEAIEEFKRAGSNILPGRTGEGRLRAAEAAYWAGEAHRLAHRQEDAVANYRRAVTGFPNSIWAAKAEIGVARAYVRMGKALEAMGALAQVSRQAATFPAEAAVALNLNTVLYRLHVLPAVSQAPDTAVLFDAGVFGSDASKFRNGVAVLVDKDGRVVAAHLDGWSIFSGTTESNPVLRDKRVNEDYPTAIALAPDGGVAVATESFIRVYRSNDGVTWTAPRDVTPQVDKVPIKTRALVSTWRPDWLVADDANKSIRRLSRDFQPREEFAPFHAVRLAVNDLDDVAALDEARRSIVLFDRTGAQLPQVAPIDRKNAESQGWDPVDIAFDALGNLYVLHRKDGGSILAYGPDMKLIRRFRFGVASGGAGLDPVAFSINADGRFMVFDDKADRVRVFK